MKTTNKTQVIQRRTAIYLRVSTTRQAEEGFSLDAQLERCKAYCVYRGIDSSLIDIYKDDGYSAKDTNRPAMKSLLKRCDSGIYEYVIIWSLDRFTRSIADFAELLKRFSSNKINLAIVSQNIDMTSLVGELIANILVIFAEYERKLTSQRTREGIRSMLLQGLYPFGGERPLGYNRKDHHLHIIPEEAEAIQYMFDVYYKTHSTKEAEALCLLNYPQYYWSQQSIIQRLKNPVYIGTVIFQGETFINLHESIINKDLFESVQIILSNQSRESKHIYIFKDLVYCGHCGSSLRTVNAYNKKGNLYLYYKCTHCKQTISEKQIIEQIMPTIGGIGKKVDKINKEVKPTLSNLNERIKYLNKVKEDALSSMMDGSLDISEYKLISNRVEKELVPLRKKISKINISLARSSVTRFSSDTRINQYLFAHRHIKKIDVDLAEKKFKNIELL